MIPTHLEKLILCKDAVYQTAVVGRSGLCVIPVPEKSTVVITNFTYFGFVDFVDPETPDINQDRSVHQMIIRSDKSQNHFVIKEDIFSEDNQGNTMITQVNGKYQESSLYLIHDTDITIEISVAPTVVGLVSTPGIAPNALKIPNPPVSYGSDPATAIPQTISEVYGGGIGEYQPLTRRFAPPSAATPFLTGSMLYPIVAATALNPTFAGGRIGQRTYPIVNIGYVEIKRQLGAELFSTG